MANNTPEPPPMAEHHPKEFHFALRTLHKMAMDSELFPAGAELQEWFKPTWEEDPASALLGLKKSKSRITRPVESITFARGLADDLKQKQEQKQEQKQNDADDASASSSLTDFEPAVANASAYCSPMAAAHTSKLAGIIFDRQQRNKNNNNNNNKKVFSSLDSDDGDSLAEDLAYLEKRREELKQEATRNKQLKEAKDNGIAMALANGPKQRNNNKVSAFELDDSDGDSLTRDLAYLETRKQEEKEADDNGVALALAGLKQKYEARKQIEAEARKQREQEEEVATRKQRDQEQRPKRQQEGGGVVVRHPLSGTNSTTVASVASQPSPGNSFKLSPLAAEDDARRCSVDVGVIDSIVDLPLFDPTNDAEQLLSRRATRVDDNSQICNGAGGLAWTMLPPKRGVLSFEYRTPGFDVAGIEAATSAMTKDGSFSEDDDDDTAYREFEELCCNKNRKTEGDGIDVNGSDDDSDKDIRRLAKNKEEAMWEYSPVPSVHERDIDYGGVLGKGGFCEVRLADLKEDRNSKRNNCGNKKKHRYAMKYLAPGIGEKRICPASGRNKQFERGIADLAIEARFLALLSHENIIGLHYVSGGGSLGAQYNTKGDDDNDDDGDYLHQFGVFLLLDPLYESLAKRIEDTYVPRVFRAIGRVQSDDGKGKGRSSLSRSSSLRSSLVGRIMRREPNRQAIRPPSRGDLLLDAWRTQLVERLEGLRGVASALRYLHDDCNVIYRDVKPDNIGFQRVPHVRCHCGRGNPQPSSLLGIKLDNGGGGICTCYDEVPKLFDFGLAKELKPRYKQIHPHHMDGRGDMDTYKLTGKSGSRRYMAPEVAFATPYNDRADVYSFGIMLYQVASLVTPFEGYSLYRHEDEILNCGERPDLKIPAAKKALSKAKSIRGRGGSCPYAEWLTDPDGKKRAKMLSKLTKCVWTKDLQQLIGQCWEDDMRLRPSMGYVERRLGGCIQELAAAAIPMEGVQSTDGTAATTTVSYA